MMLKARQPTIPEVCSPTMLHILAESGPASGGMGRREFDMDYFDDSGKMTRAQFLMSQVDLDPIQSEFSQEQKQTSKHPTYRQHGFASRQEAGQQRAEATMGDQSINSVSHEKSLRSSANGQPITASGHLNSSNVFKSPHSAQKPPKQQSLPRETEKRVEKQADSKFSRKEQIKILKDSLKFFDRRMEFDTEIFREEKKVLVPTHEDITAYATFVTCSCKMENEIPVIALIYVERMLQKTGILLNKFNWKRILLVCLCVASKVWDDDSLENVHFPKVMADVSIHMINKLEKIYLDLFLNYDLVVKGSEYAKYYFLLNSLAAEMKNKTQIASQGDDQGQKRSRRDDWA